MADKQKLFGNDKDIEDLVKAHYPLLYIVSSEEKRVEKGLAKVAALEGLARFQQSPQCETKSLAQHR